MRPANGYIQVNMSLRGAARYVLGAVDWGFLGANHPPPHLDDIERILNDLRTIKVEAKSPIHTQKGPTNS